MEVSWALLANAVIAGLLLGGFYAAMSVGISISFGMLDVVNIAHPAFIILGSYIAYIVNDRFGLDPIVVSLLVSPLFFLLGAALYRVYYYSFERRGQESLRGLAFFFGILFITEVALVLVFGVDYRMVSSRYGDVTWRAGEVGFPMRLVVPFLVSMVMVIGVQLFLTHSFFGRAVLAVAQDPLALRLMGVNPVRVTELAFALSIATAGVAGSFLIVIQPVQPAIGREFIGRLSDRHSAGATGDRARIHRPGVRGVRAGRHGLDLGHAARRPRARARRVLHLHLLRAVVGAGRFVRPPARDAGVSSVGAPGKMSGR